MLEYVILNAKLSIKFNFEAGKAKKRNKNAYFAL